MISFVAGDEDAGRRVDAVLAERTGHPRPAVREAVRTGAVTVAGTTVKPGHRLAPGDLIEGVLPPTDTLPQPEDIPVDVRYKDERVLVVSKPAGLVTHPSGGHRSGTLVNALLGLGLSLSASDPLRPGLVHRLDRDTSGLLLVARDDEAHAALAAALKARHVERVYLALVRGEPDFPSGTIDAPLGRHPHRRTLMAIVPGGRPAVTHHRTLSQGDGVALLEVRLETGRTHQIRVHLASIGHPVLGDRTYGGATERARALGLTRPFLHAVRLTFPHPDDGRAVTVTDPLPTELVDALGRAGLDVP